MRHYEIVLLIHPDQSDKAHEMVNRNKALVQEKKGVVHRVEDWGRKPLAYPIQKAFKAHYVLMNIECDLDTLRELEAGFKFNDAIIRRVVIQRKEAITEPSAMVMNTKKDEKNKDASYSREITYSNVYALKRYYIMESGRIIPARITNTSARDQRRVAHAVKLARTLALLPYCDRH